LIGAIAGLLALGAGSPVSAQEGTNSLQSITPENGATLGESPATIVLSFNQELRVDDQVNLSLICAQGQPQNVSEPEVDKDALIATFTLLQPVPRGTCSVQWWLADGEGKTFLGPEITTFAVSTEPAATTSTVAGAVADPNVTTTTSSVILITPSTGGTGATETTPNQGSSGGALWLGRLLSTLGILAVFGGLALIALGWPEGPEYIVTVRYLRAAWLVGLIGTVLYLIAFAAKYGDLSFGAAMNPSAWLDLKDAGWPGRGALLRLALVAASGWVATRPERIIDPTSAMWGWGLPGAAVAVVALSRVEGPAAWLGVLVGIAHLLGAAVWFGGVALVSRVVLAGPGEEDLLHATRAFTRISGKAILVVVVTGLIQTMRLVGNPVDSNHGKVLLLKVVAVVGMVFVGVAARQQVRLRLDRAHELTVPLADRFRRAFGAETAIGVVVLAFSGWMLALTPAKVNPLADEGYGAPIPFVDPLSGIDARVLLGPGRVGLNGFRIEVEAPAEGITQLSLRFVPPVGSNGHPVLQEIPLTTSGTAWLPTANGLPFDVAGTWTLELSAATATGVLQAAQQSFSVSNPDGSQLTVPADATVAPAAPQINVIDQTAPQASFVTTTTTTLALPATTPPG
jgi:putative copper export protein/methionine-rich copper-binding protein CopC